MKTVVLSLVLASLLSAQTPDTNKKAAFEVAAIRPATDDGNHSSNSDKGLYRTHNLTIKELIARAYDVDISMVSGGPNWVDADSYDISARIPEEFAQQTREKLPQMIGSLLTDRFQLVVHREPKQVSGYTLVLARKGSKMEQAKPDEKGSGTSTNNEHLKAHNLTMEAFARYLTRNREVGMPVVDKTGLTGAFNFEMEWKPDQLQPKPDAPVDDRPSLFTALQERLGLELKSAKVPIMTVVIDHAEKPREN
jgi:uncharacterized protein (TIGR03435 family)